MSNDQEAYNGWANYETWCMGLWLSNDEATYRHVHDLVTAQKDSYHAAEAIKKYVEEMYPIAERASVFVDLLNHALHRVDWVEVAESFLVE